MKIEHLGRSDIKISSIVLGTWAIGGWMWGSSNEKDSLAAITASLDSGVTTIDTAPIYGMGYSEELVGKAIKGRRKNVIIATKCGMRWSDKDETNPHLSKSSISIDASPESIKFECEQSLKRLGVETIDLYQIHWPDPHTSIEDSWKAMVKLKEQGKVRAIGVSNFSLAQLQEAHSIHPVDSIQSPYSLLRRDIEQDILPFCKENHISVLVYSPLERGMLTGKITLNTQFPKGDHRTDRALFALENRGNIIKALDLIQPIAARHHVTLAEVIINCTMHIPGITAVLVGARNAKQAIENADAANFGLTPEEREFIGQTLLPTLVKEEAVINR
jgi:aryl-alcohol dehydrogenase-like predicted oxidoreductase